jgi:CheY-like chemotaxis protein/anti-sigma regulatory factor (Ser/Thr protein kinase)
MASGIAHDINNGLSPVSLYAETILEREPNLRTDTQEYLRTIQRAVDDVGQTLDRLNDFSRRREPARTPSPIDVNALVEQVKSLTRARWKDMPLRRGIVIDLHTDLAHGLPAVPGVESELREALTNLVINAVDALPAGGTVAVRTRLVTPDDRDGATTPLVQVEVSDTGIGMSDDTRLRCLEPFFTTKGAQGTGLGLAMVYGMTQRHGATLDIESRVGEGTTVRLTFIPKPHTPVGVRQAVELLLPPPMRILVVDDDPVLVRSLSHVLERDGHLVTTARDGREGIEALSQSRRAGRLFDVLITDLSMPHVDGSVVAAAAKRASPATNVVLLTGWGRRMLADDELPPNVDQVLGKPPKLHELRAALEQVTAARKPEDVTR